MTKIQIETATLYHGDCLDIMKSIPDGSIDAIITDPPYGTTACKWDSVIPFEPMWEQLKRIIKPNGAIVLFSSQPFTTLLISSNIKFFKYSMVWAKSKCGSPLTAKYKPLTKHEDINVFSLHKKTLNYYPQKIQGVPYKRISKLGKQDNMSFGVKAGFEYGSKDGMRHPNTILDYPQKWRRQDQKHPTQKPVELIEYLVKTYTQENETVLDFTMGSGTTGVACKNLNRKFIGIELDEKYFQISCKRIGEQLL
jgi:site-specific DNA-methyltransferase (adenine-specific)